jgi:hypothetical protein
LYERNKEHPDTTTMKKIALVFLSLLFVTDAARAQNATGTAQQSVKLALSNALEVTFTSNNSATGNAVNLSFTTADHYANGVESAEQELKVRSNKNFKVGAKIDMSSFSYVGNGNLNNVVTPANAFTLKVTQNTTGGNVASGFSNYSNLTSSDQDIILNGTNGDNQKFAVKYKCNPGWGLPAGTYSFAIVYTATQQ